MNPAFINLHDQNRTHLIESTCRDIERLRLARFYFESDGFGTASEPLPDTRTHVEYFELLERNDKYPEKTKVRRTIKNIVLILDNLKCDLHLSSEEETFFESVRQSFVYGFGKDFIDQLIVRWPRIYVFYDEVKPTILNFIMVPELYVDGRIHISEMEMEGMCIPDQYKNDGTISSEIDYNAKPTITEVTYKDHPPNKFNYRREQINLKFIRNLTPDIRSLINKKLKAHLKFKNGSGFSGHHIIPRKKLEVFHKLNKQCKIMTHRFNKKFGLIEERFQQYIRMRQLAGQFQDHGLLEAVKPFKTLTTDLAVSPAGNIFYGPQFRSDDDQSGFSIDDAAALVLSKDEYKSVVDLDSAMNDFFRSYGFELSEKFFESRTIDNFINHVIDKLFSGHCLDPLLYTMKFFKVLFQISQTFTCIAINHELRTEDGVISFDPRLVEQIVSEGVSKWAYRDRRLAERNLPGWFDTLLQDISKELGVELVYDLNLNPVELLSDGDEYELFILRPLPLIPIYVTNSSKINFVADTSKIYKYAEVALNTGSAEYSTNNGAKRSAHDKVDTQTLDEK